MALLLAFGVGPEGRCLAQGRGPARVEVAAVVKREVAPTLELVGTVRPSRRTVVATEVSGLVAHMPVDEGEEVAEGQLLCRLRSDRRRFGHAQALARQEELAAVKVERNTEKVMAEYERKRTERLWKGQRCTEKEWLQAQADEAVAQSRVDQAGHAVEAQKAIVQTLADDLARTEIHAPFAGAVVAKRTEVGSWVDVGGSMLVLLDLSTVRVRVPVPETIVRFCPVGAEALVTAEALGKDYAGRVSRVMAEADERARTFPVDIDIPNPTGELKAGMFARAVVPSGPKAEHLVVPKDAVVVRGVMSMIYVVRSSDAGQMAMPMPVEVVSELLDYVAVRAEGLAAGDRVVVRGNEFMFGPSPVIAVDAKPQDGV